MKKSNLYRHLCRYKLLFCLFHRFFHRIPAAEDDLDVLIGVHLDAFHHLTDDAVIVAAVAIFFFINVTDDEPPFGQTQIFNK